MNIRVKLLGVSLLAGTLSLDFAGTTDAKKAHLSNQWYPSDPEKLKNKLDDLDKEAASLYGAEVEGVKALIVPHAGLKYSGSLAAGCFRLVDPKKTRRIIILAPAHHAPFEGVILPSYSSYRLRSGVLAVDSKMVQELKKIGGVFTTINHQKKDPHYKEHALEIQLPLIQKYAPRARIVPLIIGSLSTEAMQTVTQTLKSYIDHETIVVVSSDFTHYGPRYNNVPFKNDELVFFRLRSLDNRLLQPIFKRSLEDFMDTLVQEEATCCGKNALCLLLALCGNGVFKNEVPYLIGYDTSRTKDTDSKNGVSYVGLVFGKSSDVTRPVLTSYEKRSLLELAHHVMQNDSVSFLTQELVLPIITPTLQQSASLFMEKSNNYVSVPGSYYHEPLYQAVIRQAQAVSVKDPLSKRKCYASFHELQHHLFTDTTVVQKKMLVTETIAKKENCLV